LVGKTSTWQKRPVFFLWLWPTVYKKSAFGRRLTRKKLFMSIRPLWWLVTISFFVVLIAGNLGHHTADGQPAYSSTPLM
jgi:hypothetical protein